METKEEETVIAMEMRLHGYRHIVTVVGGILVLLCLGMSVPVPDAWATTNMDCLRCHNTETYRVGFSRSVHGNNSCTSCHRGIDNLAAHMRGDKKPPAVSCGDCHQEIGRQFLRNFHYLRQDFRCTDCHAEIHALRKTDGNIKQVIVEKCTQCHTNDDYVASGHSEAVLRGNQDAAVCSDCHGLHDTRVYHTSFEAYPQEARQFYTEKCKRCHGDAAIAKRNNLPPDIVRRYEETYHGKVQDVGYPTLVAGCADCHTTHNILPKTDPRSSIHPVNLVDNCGRCHKGFHPRFVEYKAHPDYRDRKNYPSLYWTFVFMEILLGGTFLFFWTHTFLWWRKTYWEKHRREKEGLLPSHCLLPPEGLVQVQRFSGKERIMHVILILSFFTLVLTGFPLKYPNTPWSQIIMTLWGGAETAGLFHRAAAFVLILIVAYVAVLGLKYLFPRGKGTEGFVQRLLGPDSLVPNLKDLEDIKGMFLWFFNRGPMPRFERWTYWEKFDFWAVFWGMFAIGGSGLLLWKPEWSSWIVPGWILNVATVVHSEEALLAALFIFTVHFFNTHFIPTKFPMDNLIFTGRYNVNELVEQRPMEYERLVAEGRLESLKRKFPSIPLKLISGAFGLGSLLLGLLLTVLIFMSLWVH